MITQRTLTGHWEAWQPNRVSHGRERAAAWYNWVNGAPVSTGVATCPLLAPWESVIQPPLLTLAGKHSRTGSDYSADGGGEKCLFIINKTEGGSLLFLGGVISVSKK